MRQFVAGPNRYEQNVEDGAEAVAITAVLISPSGEREPAIAITTNARPRLVIPTTDAIRIAHQIADVATDQKNKN